MAGICVSSAPPHTLRRTLGCGTRQDHRDAQEQVVAGLVRNQEGLSAAQEGLGRLAADDVHLPTPFHESLRRVPSDGPRTAPLQKEDIPLSGEGVGRPAHLTGCATTTAPQRLINGRCSRVPGGNRVGRSGRREQRPCPEVFWHQQVLAGGIRHAVVRCAGELSQPPPRELTVRKIIVPALAFLLGITITFIIRGSAVKERAVAPAVPTETTVPASLPPRGNPGTTLSAQNVEAWQLLHEGRAHEAQDVFLGILSTDPENQDAMRGLVAARRAMAGDDPSELRRQVAVYEDAIRRGTDTKEHYTRLAMIMLVAASERAAQEIEAPSEAASPPLRKPIQASTPPAVRQPEDVVPPSGKLPPPAAHPVKPSGPQTPPPSPAAKRQTAPPVSKRQTASPRPAPAPQAVPPPPAPAPQASPPPAPAPQASPPPA